MRSIAQTAQEHGASLHGKPDGNTPLVHGFLDFALTQ
jgi:hypothetical protein